MKSFCWHNWNKWSKLIPGYNNEKTQYKQCAKCGKMKFRNLGYCNGTNVDQANKAVSEVVE